MPKIKDLSTISGKWTTVTPQRQSEYKDGVQNPREDWKAATLAAAPRYQTGVQAAIAEKRFDKGVSNAGTSKWQQNAATKGPGRWAEGVASGASAYEAGFAPYREVIANTTLPNRGPKGDPSNINRVAVMAKALNDKKKAMTK